MSPTDLRRYDAIDAELALTPARYLPDWLRGLRQLSAYLAYSLVSGHIRMDLVELPRFLELEDAALA